MDTSMMEVNLRSWESWIINGPNHKSSYQLGTNMMDIKAFHSNLYLQLCLQNLHLFYICICICLCKSCGSLLFAIAFQILDFLIMKTAATCWQRGGNVVNKSKIIANPLSQDFMSKRGRIAISYHCLSWFSRANLFLPYSGSTLGFEPGKEICGGHVIKPDLIRYPHY